MQLIIVKTNIGLKQDTLLVLSNLYIEFNNFFFFKYEQVCTINN